MDIQRTRTTIRTHWRHMLAVVLVALLGALVQGCGSGLSVGNPAPDFSLSDARGGTVSLADYQGQPVLLYFHMALG